MQLTNIVTIISTAALASASTHPSLHGGNQRFHKRRNADERDLAFKEVIPQASSTSSASSASGEYIPFCNGKTTEIPSSGNVGTAGDWGCNMQVIDESIIDLYDYTTTFTSSKDTHTCSCFNNIGPGGVANGSWLAAITFSIKEGESAHVAFDKDSQGACACSPGSTVPKTSIGQFAGTWLEWDWGSTRNSDRSGADASVLVAAASKLPYYGMKIEVDGTVCSWVKSDGSNEGAYVPGVENYDGVGCNGHYGHLDVTLGDNFTV